jgi:crossover junction endodeoxyribonuclease RuvC
VVRVLGVDPGLTRCGVGVIEVSPSGRAGVVLVAAGVLRTPPHADIATRLHDLHTQLGEWLDTYRPTVVAVERVFSQHNVRTVMGTAQAAAMALLAAASRDLPVALHTPSEVKAAVTGSGTADKEQVGRMVSRLLGVDSVPGPPDAADALALALCHLWRAVPSGVRAAGRGSAPPRRPAPVSAAGPTPGRGLLAAAQGTAP